MKKNVALTIAILFSFTVFGQPKKVKGDLSTIDTVDLKILNIYPDSFPNVSVVFKAESRKGEPVWNLTKENMTVKENSQKCEVISLEQISKNKPINLGIVIDHSGSMMLDQSQLFDQNGNPLFYFDGYSLPVFPEGYTSPIDNAKSAVKTFVSTFNAKKDFISVIGFSSIVDKKLALTQNISKINSFVDSMQADYSTALYDAMISGIDEIKKADGVKVLVVLTDGQDNSSKSNWNEVIEKANKENIPIYIVGLGDVNTSTLSLITKSTQGQFYLVQSSSSLNKVYAEISKKVQAFYSLVYSSSNFSSADSSRQVELSFDIDSIYLLTSPSTQNFPAELIDFIAKKESEKRNVMYGGMVLAAILTSGTLLFYYQRRKRNKNKPYIKNIFPNPTDEILNIEYEGDATELHIINTSGLVAKTFEITGAETHFNLTDLQNGNYIAILQSEGVRSNQVKFILQR
jgi:Ca-activated chloride channel family protein